MDYSVRDCVLLNTVMAARAMTRRYDERLKPFGISVSQFSVMMTVRQHPEMAVAHMAERIAMDRTTLLRNLELLERKGLIATEPVSSGNGRVFALTDEGARLLDAVIPHWRAAQTEVGGLLETMSKDELLVALRALTAG